MELTRDTTKFSTQRVESQIRGALLLEAPYSTAVLVTLTKKLMGSFLTYC
jgi:hypothetical protein